MRLPAIKLVDGPTQPWGTRIRRASLLLGLIGIVAGSAIGLGGVTAVGAIGIALALLWPSWTTLKAMHEEDYLEMLSQAQTEAREEIRQAALTKGAS